MLGYVYSLSLRIMKMLRIVHWRWITTLLDEFWLLAILGYSTSQVLVVQQSKHLQRTHHHCRPVESPPACPPPMQSSRITSSVSTTMAHRCWSWSIITSRLHGECVYCHHRCWVQFVCFALWCWWCLGCRSLNASAVNVLQLLLTYGWSLLWSVSG